MYSPSFASHIAEGEDYLDSNYFEPDQVQSHIQSGTIVGFGTASPGKYIIKAYLGYPNDEFIDSHEFKLRLGIKVIDEKICVRDLYDLLDWLPECPESQQIKIENGIYHITLCSNPPVSGIIGDNQIIYVFLSKLEEFPKLSDLGVPNLVDWD